MHNLAVLLKQRKYPLFSDWNQWLQWWCVGRQWRVDIYAGVEHDKTKLMTLSDTHSRLFSNLALSENNVGLCRCQISQAKTEHFCSGRNVKYDLFCSSCYYSEFIGWVHLSIRKEIRTFLIHIS